MITLRFFAQLADQAHTRECRVPWAPTPRQLVSAHAPWATLAPQVARVVVNNEWADWDSALGEEDEVALLPAWSAP
jgi:molybdopterin converting factor small subunit